MTQHTPVTASRDWFLIGIVAGIASLIVSGLIFALSEPVILDYMPEDEPQGVAFNYVLALQQREYARAYSYLSTDLPSYPADADQFFSEVGNIWNCTDDQLLDSSLRIDDIDLYGQRASIMLEQTVYNSGELFTSGSYTRRYAVDLVQEAGDWRISRSDICWNFVWNEEPKS